MPGGAVAILEKPYGANELADAVYEAIMINRNAQAAHRQIEELRSRFETLDLRQRDVMTLVVTGVPTKTIARELGVCQRTAA
jgi:FixJ family two-component response regulator